MPQLCAHRDPAAQKPHPETLECGEEHVATAPHAVALLPQGALLPQVLMVLLLFHSRRVLSLFHFQYAGVAV